MLFHPMTAADASKKLENARGSTQARRQSWPSFTAVLATLVLAFGIRAYDLANLTLHGDYAYSVYAARQDWTAITLERVLDGHPPLYYYLLHIWMLLMGQNELTIRMLSVVIGVLVVALTFALGVHQFGPRVGLLGSLFAALSPALVHYSRMPRMYILLAMLAVLSAYTLIRALELGHRRNWLGYFGATLLLLYTHYYGLALVAGEVAYVLWTTWRLRRPNRRFLWVTTALAGSYLPWLLFAALGSATTTARIISNAPWPTDVQGVVEQFWIPLNVGDFLEISLARPFSLAMLGIWFAAFLLGRTTLRQRWADLRFLVFALGIPIAASVLVFVFLPYAVRPRFLIFCIPPYLLLLSVMLSSSRGWLTGASTVAIITISGYALVEAYKLEPYVVEEDAIRLTERLQVVAQSEDAVIFQAFWQIGYFTTHFQGARPSLYNMSSLSTENVESLLSHHPRVWLAMFRTPLQTPEYPLEEWLDRHWHKAEEVPLGETRLLSYIRPSNDPWQSKLFDFGPSDGGPVLRLTSVQVGKTDVKPREMIAVGLRWQALLPITERYTIFLKLVDASGHSPAGTDSEPLGGSEPTAGWQQGRIVEDRLALVVPADVPPGDYSLLVGIHATGNPQPLTTRGPDISEVNQGGIIGRLRVSGFRPEESPVRLNLGYRLGDSITLLGYSLDIDSYEVGATRMVTALTDNPIQISYPKRAYRPADTIEITLYWQAHGSIANDYTVFTHLQDSSGRLWGQLDSQPSRGHFPTSRWQFGEVVVDRYRLKIDPATPPGDYQLRVGMYLLSTMQRLPVSTTVGQADDLELRRIRIER